MCFIVKCPCLAQPPKFPRQSDIFWVLLTSLALPAKFIKGLRNEEATEGATATLCCELSKEAPVQWRKGLETLRAGDRVSLKQDGTVCELEIRGLTVADAGQYSCVCKQESTSAILTIKGNNNCGQAEPCFGVQLLVS